MSLVSQINAALTRIGQEIKAIRVILDAAVSGSTPSTFVKRSDWGHAGFAAVDIDSAPAEAWHATRRDYVDSSISTAIAGVESGGGIDQATLDAHAADTTDIHGIADTAALVRTTDARLSDARTPTSHTHIATTDLTATGTKSSATYLRGDNTWQTPPNTTYTEISVSEITTGTASTTRTISGRRAQEIVNKANTPSIVNLTDAATITLAPSVVSNIYRVTIAGDRTIAVPSTILDGLKLLLQVTASGGDRTLTLTTGVANSFKFGSDITSIPVILNGTTTFIGCIYRTASQRWHVLAVSSGH